MRRLPATRLRPAPADGPTSASTDRRPDAAAGVLETPRPASIGPVPRVLLRDTEPATDPGPSSSPARRDAPTADPAPLPAPRRDRPRRHGRRPQGPRPRPRPRPGRQGPARGAPRQRPSWSAASSRRPRSAASSSIPASSRSTSWAPSPTAGPYFTMKLVKGRTLAELLAARPDPPTTSPGSWRSSSQSPRRWPTPTPAA